jgi:hypothetical protein
MYNQFI